MTGKFRFIALAGVLTAACGGSGSGPTRPSGAASPAPSSPQLKIQIDSLGSAVAIAGVTHVSVDARPADGGINLRYEFQFGDGTSAEGPTATHVYQTAGTYTVTATVTDVAGRLASSTGTLVVKTFQGTWFYFGYNDGAGGAEARRLVVTAQRGTTLEGVLVNGSVERSFTGEISNERTVHLALADRSEQYDGVVPSQVSGGDAPLSLTVHGGTADGLTLRFEPVVGDPTGAAPVARLSIQIDNDGSKSALVGFTPIQFVATGSSGESLRYIIEFGDRKYATDATAVHQCTKVSISKLAARVTVADKFGRFASTTAEYGCTSLSHSQGQQYAPNIIWVSFFGSGGDRRRLAFELQNGKMVSGFYDGPETGTQQRHFSGELSGQNTLRIVLDGGGMEFNGRAVLASGCSNGDYEGVNHLYLTARGGTADGATLSFFCYDPF